LIDIENVTKTFHSIVAVDNISLRIDPGEVFGVLGPNGAGKTTLFKLIAGFINPDKGTVKSEGRWPAIGYKPNKMRVHQYLELVASIAGAHETAQSSNVVDDTLRRLKLLSARNKRISDCSKGMRQRLALAQALIGDPPLLLLDEPSNGLDPEGQSDICQQIKELHEAGKTIVLASHHLQEVTQVCTRLIIMNEGRIHYKSTMEDALTQRQHVTIWVNKDLAPLSRLIGRLHANIEVGQDHVILNQDAMRFGQQVMRLLLGAGYDIKRVEQNRVSLSEIYAEAVR
jgi:ABC-2 type transport system ATP-binding protein